MGRQRGFSYVVVMFLVAVMSLVSTRALRNTLTEERRSKEAELLYTGMAYRDAIAYYHQNPLGSAKTLPPNLKALLEDERWSSTRRPLRKLYRDPITGSKDWGLIYLNDDGKQLIGVYSLSSQKPIKQGGFPAEMGDLSKAATYRDWKFIYRIEQSTGVPTK